QARAVLRERRRIEDDRVEAFTRAFHFAQRIEHVRFTKLNVLHAVQLRVSTRRRNSITRNVDPDHVLTNLREVQRKRAIERKAIKRALFVRRVRCGASGKPVLTLIEKRSSLLSTQRFDVKTQPM